MEVVEISEESQNFEERPYQQAIVSACINRNSIVYLPTGAGKTYIAIQVIKHFSEALEIKYSEGGKRSIFLANTVCLAKQQAVYISNILSYNVEVLCGEQNVDYWKFEEWNNVLEKSEILVATAQVILDAIKHRYINVAQINVIVFDECHHGRKDHPYHEIMKQIDNSHEIRVIGLTGMLIGNDNKIKPAIVEDELRKLESVYRSTIITVNNLDDYKNVLMCSTKAKEGCLRFERDMVHPSVSAVTNILDKTEEMLLKVELDNYITINPKSLRPTTPKKVKDLILMFKDFHYQAMEMGPYGGYLSLLSTLIQFELIKRWCDTLTYREIVKVCITTVERCINKLERDIGLSHSDPPSILRNSSHKVQRLFALLQKKFNEPDRDKNLQCLVFVERRSTAKALYHALKAYAAGNPDFPIVPDFMVGINNEMPESIEAILNHNYNSIALEKFKKKETNLIVASSVLEEGIDLQICNLVVMYDSPKVYRSYVQARGRARDDKSDYVVLVDDDTFGKFQTKVINWRAVDKKLKSDLVCKTIDRPAPSEEEIEREMENVWEPFVTPISKSVLNNCMAVSLLNHYANKMPCDRFTNVKLMWRREDVDGKVIAAVELPAQSTIKGEIVSDPQKNVKLAKQHAAFKACIMLYERGELNDNLVPVDEKQKVEQFTPDYFPHWKDYKSDKKSAGTRNHRRYHNIKVPDVLVASAPKINVASFLYRISVRPKFKPEQKTIEVFKELLENQREFGVLTSKRMPRLCKMALFQSFGEIEVEISAVPTSVTLKSKKELETLQNFHVAIFRDVLKTWENFFVLDRSSYLIVPLTTDSEIDFELAAEFQAVEQPRELTYDEIKATDFSRKNYFQRVMNPVYRYTDQNYIVIDVPEHMTPLSPFPDENYTSYKDYIEQRFQLKIVKDDQPMIEVKGISQNLNLFFPGTGASGKQRKHEKHNLAEHYIPEICHNYKFPGDFWLKATLLPSICHRMTYMLLAEELRIWLIDEKIDRGMGQQIYRLDVDYENYDTRETFLRDLERDQEAVGKFMKFAELLKKTLDEKVEETSKDEAQHTKALLLWDRSQLPIDIDRNWLTISEVDIDYYFSFLNLNRNKQSPSSISKLQQLNLSPKRLDRSLMDSNDRSKIEMIGLKGITESVQQKNLIKVLTTSNAGDVFDMERYEVLGDGFLKFISSLYLYKRHEDWHEGFLTSLKGRLVSNRNLFYIGNNFGLSKMIKSLQFNAKEALPPSVRVPENAQKILENHQALLSRLLNVTALSQQEIIGGFMDTTILQISRNEPKFAITQEAEEESDGDSDGVEKSMLTYIQQHFVGDKIVADAVEAFLGVVVQSLGIDAGLKMCRKLKVLPDDENLDALLTERIPIRKLNSSGATDRINNRVKLEEIIGYNFEDPLYLVQALTHASYPIKTLGSYQQLEFLGDAVLDFLITSYISEQCTTMDPGKLTDLRSALVNNVTLACVVVRNGIHKFLRAQNLLLSEAIKKFVDYQTNNNHEIVLDQIILLETEVDAPSAESVDVPKVVGDIFESIVGAVYLDSGLNLETTWKVIYKLLKDELHNFMHNVPLQIVRQLFEFEKGKAEPKFYKVEEIDENTVGVPVEITVNGERKMFLGIGKNRSVAKKCAAKIALKYLKNPAH